MYNETEIIIGFILLLILVGFIVWACLEWEKTKLRRLELEKIIYISKCKFKELEIQAQKDMQNIKQTAK